MFRIILIIVSVIITLRSDAQSLYFPPNDVPTWDTMSPSLLGYCDDRIDSLYQYLEQENTKAFILLKNGKIVLEKYFGTHTVSTPWRWASAGKTITAFMIGMAQQENHLSIDDITSEHLGNGWTACTSEQESAITIRNQLSMTTGLDDNVADHYCTIDTCLIYKADAGARWAYHNGPYTLLDAVINNATGQTLNAYTSAKLKIPTGMTGSFVPIGFNNVYFSNARSMARFGLLMLNGGNWNGTQIMSDSSYFHQMINSSQLLNKSYGYLWWLNGKGSYMLPQTQMVFTGDLIPDAPSGVIAAVGSGGQFLNIVSSDSIVWLRMGDDPTTSEVPFLMNNEIWKYINKLPCEGTSLTDNESSNESLVFPNPTMHVINIHTHTTPYTIRLLDIFGNILHFIYPDSNKNSMYLREYADGLYIINIQYRDGTMESQKIFLDRL